MTHECSDNKIKHLTQNQKLLIALACIKNRSLRSKIKQIYLTEMRGCSIFWDHKNHSITLVNKKLEIIFREK